MTDGKIASARRQLTIQRAEKAYRSFELRSQSAHVRTKRMTSGMQNEPRYGGRRLNVRPLTFGDGNANCCKDCRKEIRCDDR